MIKMVFIWCAGTPLLPAAVPRNTGGTTNADPGEAVVRNPVGALPGTPGGVAVCAETVMVSVSVADPLALEAVRAMALVPAAMGVPEISPVLALMARFAGRPGAAKLVGWLLAVIW